MSGSETRLAMVGQAAQVLWSKVSFAIIVRQSKRGVISMKKKRRKKRYVVLAFFFALFFGGGIAFYVYGQTDTTNTATNVVTVGNVDVTLTMESDNAGKIVPGETAIDNKVIVGNIGAYPAYIRVFVKKYWKITKDGTELSEEQITQDYPKLSANAIDIQLSNDKWTKGTASDSYPGYDCYYYNEVVDISKRDVDAIHFSDSYKVITEQTAGDGGITNDLLEKFVNDGVSVYGNYSVIVEAIQADAFTPDTTEVHGQDRITNWKDKPDTSVTMPPVSFDPVATPVGVVNFTSENTDITNADSFITMNNLVPGSTEERVVEIKNTSSQKLPVYVYAESAEEYDNLNEDEKEWLEQLQLIVGKEDGTILYQNSLYKNNSDEPMLSKENPILIDEFPSNTSENLYVAIHCPASWEKGDITVKVNWIFSSKKAIPDPTPRPPGGGGGSIIRVTNTPEVTEEPLIETEAPEPTETPEVTPESTVAATPTVTPAPTATPVLVVTDAPTISVEPSDYPGELPVETSVVVMETPDMDGEDEIPATQKPISGGQEVPMSTLKVSDGIKPLQSGEPDEFLPVETLEEEATSDERPRRTSTPKQPTKVEAVYPTKTGDATPIVVWLIVFVVSGVGMSAAFTVYRRHR